MALIAVMIVIGVFAVTPDGTGFLQPIDTRLSGALHVPAWRPTVMVDALGSPVAIIVYAIVAGLVGWRPSDVRARLRVLVTLLLAGGAATVAALLVRRPGPGHLGDLTAANVTSFPSVSAAMLTAFALKVSAERRFRRHGTGDRPSSWRDEGVSARAVCLVAVVSVIARTLTGAAWFLDEVAGVVVGTAVAHAVSSAPSSTVARLRRWMVRAGAGSRVLGLVLAVCCGFAVLAASVSYVSMLTLPGSATFDQRTVEWLRDHGAGPLVDRAESWWLWRHLPSPTATISALPAAPLSVPSLVTALPPAIGPLIVPALPDEGRWTAAAATPDGRPEIATTSFRPDPLHPSLVATAAWINSSTTRLTLIAGTRQPGGGPGPAGGHVPPEALSTLLAVFNSGYKMKDTPGGALVEGRQTGQIESGVATLGIRDDGTPVVGEWGTDMNTADGFVALRQNLHLLVLDGHPVPGVDTNEGGRWGTVRNTLPTWRSGIGTTAHGDLVYVAGDNLTLGVLATALARAGAQQAMELDIHRNMVTFNLFTHDPDLVGHKLIPNMTRPANRYLTADWRDFVMVTSR